MLKRSVSLLVAFLIAISPVLAEGKSFRPFYGNSSYESQGSLYKANKSSDFRASNGSKANRQQKYSTYPKSTYKIGETKYKYNERYKTSGLPKVERNGSAKKEFLKSKGYSKVPAGYEVDHIIPLSKGGGDEPSNMQLIPKSVHKQKTASERKR